MKATYIDYSDTNSFSKTLLAYLAGDEALSPFYGNKPTIAGFAEQIQEKSSFSANTRSLLADDLKEQYDGLLDNSPKVLANIELLRQSHTFTVTTGHQLNIFTGPLYFVFKIVSAIRLAENLKQAFPEKDFVPVYWMATEDHDFAEINHTRVHGKKITWDTPGISATGRMSTRDIAEVVKQYISMLGLSENSSRLAGYVEEAYLKDLPLAAATRTFVHALFKEYGLVIVDADRPKLKQIFAPYIQEDILTEKSFHAIDRTSKSLESNGFATQVHAREINFFYLTDQYRERLVRTEDGRFEVLRQGQFFTKEELEAEIQQYPERFSPLSLIHI